MSFRRYRVAVLIMGLVLAAGTVVLSGGPTQATIRSAATRAVAMVHALNQKATPVSAPVAKSSSASSSTTASSTTAASTTAAASDSSSTATSSNASTSIPAADLGVVGLGDSVESGEACDCTSFVETAAGVLAAAQP